MNSTFSRFCIHRAESPIVAASGCPSTSFSPVPSAAVSRFRASKILRLGLTVVIDHLSGRVVWAGKERKAKTLLRFFRKLGPQRAVELEAVSMDMWEPYITVVGKKAPQARVIFDRFHIVKHLNEAVDKTRRERYVSTTLRHSRAAFSEPRLASGGSWRRCGPHLHRSRSRFVEQKKGVPQVWTPPREWLVRHSGASFSPSAG